MKSQVHLEPASPFADPGKAGCFSLGTGARELAPELRRDGHTPYHWRGTTDHDGICIGEVALPPCLVGVGQTQWPY